jgi:ClpP class serine protease
MGEKAIRQVKATVNALLRERMGVERAEQIATTLSTGIWTHDYPISMGEARELGLPVSTDMPKEVYKLMSLYPQTAQRRPSVEYIPAPRSRELDSQPAHASKNHPDMR